MKKSALLFMFLSFGLMNEAAWSHGSLELIECHNLSNSIILRGKALNKNNDFSFELFRNNKKVWFSDKIRLQLTDTFENKKLIENILIKKGKNQARLKVHEVPAREIRSGSGVLDFKSYKVVEKNMTCFAVY